MGLCSQHFEEKQRLQQRLAEAVSQHETHSTRLKEEHALASKQAGALHARQVQQLEEAHRQELVRITPVLPSVNCLCVPYSLQKYFYNVIWLIDRWSTLCPHFSVQMHGMAERMAASTFVGSSQAAAARGEKHSSSQS